MYTDMASLPFLLTVTLLLVSTCCIVWLSREFVRMIKGMIESAMKEDGDS